MTKRFYSCLLIAFLSILGSSALKAQSLTNDIKTMSILVFEHKTSGAQKMISEGGLIVYKLNNNSKKVYKGTLDQIDENSITVNGNLVQLKDCAMIGGRVKSQQEIIGGVTLGIGISAGALAGALAMSIPTAGAASLAVIGITGMVTGVTLMMKRKRFKLNKNWNVHSGKIEYKLD
jgi:hypothetical protein